MADPLWDKHRICCARGFEIMHRTIWSILKLITHAPLAVREAYLSYFSVQSPTEILFCNFWGRSLEKVHFWASVSERMFSYHIISLLYSLQQSAGKEARHHGMFCAFSGAKQEAISMGLTWLYTTSASGPSNETSVLKTTTDPRFFCQQGRGIIIESGAFLPAGSFRT